MSRPLVVATGDPAGIGPSIAVRAAADAREEILLFGDEALLRGAWARELAASPPSRIRIHATRAASEAAIARHAPSAEVGSAQLDALDRAIDAMLEGRGRALVTAPTSKEAIASSGTPFVGQTEHLARRAGLADDEVTMLFFGPRLKVGLVTTHVAIARAAAEITPARVERTIRHLADAMGRVSRSGLRIAVCGLNPHAGEGGLFGDEERRAITPGIEAARARLAERAELVGPFGAETALRWAAQGKVDGVVAMIHDQATIASKLLDWGDAVNVTWGLPFVRTSVDHGVAYDAAAAGAADARGMQSALRLAIALTEGG